MTAPDAIAVTGTKTFDIVKTVEQRVVGRTIKDLKVDKGLAQVRKLAAQAEMDAIDALIVVVKAQGVLEDP